MLDVLGSIAIVAPSFTNLANLEPLQRLFVEVRSLGVVAKRLTWVRTLFGLRDRVAIEGHAVVRGLWSFSCLQRTPMHRLMQHR